MGKKDEGLTTYLYCATGFLMTCLGLSSAVLRYAG